MLNSSSCIRICHSFALAGVLVQASQEDVFTVSQSALLRDQRGAAQVFVLGPANKYPESLTARRAPYAAERELVEPLRQNASNRVALYRSLGGDRDLGRAQPQ